MKKLTQLLFAVTLGCLSITSAACAHAQAQPQSCLQVACSIGGDCGLNSRMEEYARACRGVEGDCVRAICNERSCGLSQTLFDTIRACKGSDSECVRSACFHGHCQLNSSIAVITNACQRPMDNGCIRSMCLQGGDCASLERYRHYADVCRISPT